jgi:hypothetical protein
VSRQKEESIDEIERRSPRPYPRHTVEQAQIVAQAIQDKNAGKPMRRLFVAEAISRKPGSSEFKFLLSSSSKYGLTIGTEKAEYIELTNIGHGFTRPRTPDERAAALQKAAMTPELFSKIFEHYRDGKIPTESFLKNVLEREFNVPREWVEDCVKVLIANGRYAGIIRDVSGSPFVVLGEFGSTRPPTDSAISPSPSLDVIQTKNPLIMETPSEPPKIIFIGHGKNRAPLEQLKAILDQFKVPYLIAIDEAHKGRPISTKVAELMRQCGSAIFIFTGDEEYSSEGEAKRLKPSDNVVYELGAATVLYGNRIVIFREEDVYFASDYKDFGYITFEKDNLGAKAMDLLKELVAFGFLKVTPA